MSDSPKNEEPKEDRRKFIITTTIAASTACALFPLASGIPSVLDPVTKDSGNAEVPWTKVTNLATLPEDNEPQREATTTLNVLDSDQP